MPRNRALWACFGLVSTCALAQSPDDQPGWLAKALEQSRFTYDMQAGFDYWSLNPSVEADTTANLNGNTVLFLANSTPYWPYRQTSPWIKYQGTLRVGPDTVLNLKYRRDQSSGSRLDGLSLDQSWHDLGARVGVLDYKTSWCRTYDTDSPWVRENDPFCTVRTTSDPIRSSPGVQAYANRVVGDFKLQGLVGIYRPMFLNYQKDEFTNNALSPLSEVIRNDRWGVSFNAIHLASGLDFRLGYLNTNQDANYRANEGSTTERVNQNVNVVYTGVSFNLGAASIVRLTHLDANLDSKKFYPPGFVHQDDRYPDLFGTGTIRRTSDVVEWNYQASAQDVLSVAHSVYVFTTSNTTYLYSFPSGATVVTEAPNAYFNRTTNTSVSWRRDWKKGIFSVLQWTVAKAQSATQANANAPRYEVSSYGHALGLRLGYQF